MVPKPKNSIFKQNLLITLIFVLASSWLFIEAASAAVTKPEKVILISPEGTLTDTSPNYQWEAIQDASSYLLNVRSGKSVVINTWFSAAEAGCASGESICTIKPSTVLADGKGSWKVRAKNSAGTGSWSKRFKFTTGPTKPGKVILLSPEGVLTDTSPNYQWKAIQDASSYLLNVRSGKGVVINTWFSAAEVDCASGESICTIKPSTVLADGKGSWKVRAKNSAGTGSWSKRFNFTVDTGVTKPSKVILISPEGTLTDTSPNYQWEAIQDASSYLLNVRSGKSVVINTWFSAAEVGCASGESICTIKPSTVLADGKGSWKVRAKNSAGTGSWSKRFKFTAPVLPPLGGDWWQPLPGTSWQWQLTGEIDTSIDVEMYNVDLFDTPQNIIDQLHYDGRTVICYFSAGSWENWRDDQSSFPESVLGNTLDGWPDEKWLDIRQTNIIMPIMEARLDLAAQKGCDGVEPDNVDGYINNSGFPLTYQDQIDYNILIADTAHSRGLSVGLKNNLDQIDDLVSYFDWALNEQCFEYNECDSLLPFINENKAVFGVEYSGDAGDFCPKANNKNYDWLMKNLDLDDWKIDCRTYSSGAGIEPFAANNFYWSYGDTPTLLVGGTNDDNLFQWPTSELAAHLDLLKYSGGNYVRNVLNNVYNDLDGLDSNDVKPHGKSGALYDLDTFNPEYFTRLERLLSEAKQRDIIVQITFWEAFEFITGNLNGRFGSFYLNYDDIPWNPKNNINYNSAQSGIPATNNYIGTWESEWTSIGFHYTPPGMSNANAIVLGYQEKFIQKVLDSTLKFNNVLYNVQNERQWVIPKIWSDYWISFATDYAVSKGKTIYITDMADKYYMTQTQQQEVLNSNNIDFFEISQVNQLGGQTQYDEIIYARNQLKNKKKPMNAVKIYKGSSGATQAKGVYDDEDKMWRLIFGGAAAVRFHRPTSPNSRGFGLTTDGQTQIKSARMFTDEINLFAMAPNNSKLSQRSTNEAYLLENPNQEYAVYFTGTNDHTVTLDLSDAEGIFQVLWLDIQNNYWLEQGENINSGAMVSISAPDDSQYIAILRR